MKIDFFGARAAKGFLVGSLIFSLAFIVGKCTNYDTSKIMVLLNQIQKHVKFKWINDDLNDYIIKDEKLLEEKIKRDVDEAIYNYETWERNQYIPRMKNQVILKEIEKSKYTWEQKITIKDAIYYEFKSDGSQAQKLLGPTMGIRGHWVEPDPREIKE